MIKQKWNQDWYFTLDKNLEALNWYSLDKYSDASGAPSRFYDHCNWDKVELPHDWAVSMPKNLTTNTFAGGRANSRFHRFTTERHVSDDIEIYNVGWYRKQFLYDPSWEGKRVFLEFEGIYRDSIIWVNGVYMDRHNSGYTGYILEITDHLVPGEENSVAVRVDSDMPEGWWYEGAGIYRNVYLHVAEAAYFKPQQTVVKTKMDGTVNASAILYNDTPITQSGTITWEITDPTGYCCAAVTEDLTIEAFQEVPVSAMLTVAEPQLWDIEHPNLYNLLVTINEETDAVTFGIREVAFDKDLGFLLNGKPVKVRGACVHQDFGGVGVALSDNLQYYKIQRLKDMGCNAYRCSHHAPSPVLLRACDELGMLVMDETRMFGTSPEAVRQLTDLIERDRNHPSVFIWTLGNEEFSVQNISWSHKLMEKMTRIAKALDDTRPVTYGGNNGPNDIGANGISEIRGVNYIRNDGNEGGYWLDHYHEKHPEQPIIGTEESSYVMSRGSAVNEMGNGIIDSYGDVTMPWASTPKGWVKYMEIRPYFAGSFMWTGFDYRGEPNPFVTANVASSFGTIDLTGMEKPPFYYYKSWWTEEPVLKLAPHWNHTPGQEVKMAVFTNCEEITLYINGREIETQKVERFDAPKFVVTYEPGEIAVVGTRNGITYKDTLTTSGSAAEVRLTPVLDAANSEDVAIYQLDAYDANGVFCPLAADMVEISIKNGQFVGVGNGDPACLDYEQKPVEEEARYLRTFGYTKEAGSRELVYTVPPKTPNLPRSRYDWIEREEAMPGFTDDYRMVAAFKDNLDEPKTYTFTTQFTDAASYEYIEIERLGGRATIYLNDVEIGSNTHNHGRMLCNNVRPYRFYCKFQEGVNTLKIVSEQQENASAPISGYVKLGRTIENTPWHVRLHYGKARVFVKSETPETVKITAKIQ